MVAVLQGELFMANPVVKIAVVYYSGRGHTANQAKAVARGAQSVAGSQVSLIDVEEIEKNWEKLDEADAIIFGSPTYMGSVSAKFKLFMEASSHRWFEQKWKDKWAAGFTNSGSQSGDKLNTLVDLVLFAAQHSMHWINLGLLAGNNSSKGSVEDLNRLGAFVGAMSQSNTDQDADLAPPQSDLKTAEHLGRRVAEVVSKFV